MRDFFVRAIKNITKFGDTDIFPFPIENHVLFDKQKEAVDLLLDINQNFTDRLAQFPPTNTNALAPVSYTGFRWATQLDPIWNAYFLGLVLSISKEIEDARIPAKDKISFSYRINSNIHSSELFDTSFNWRAFMDHSLKTAKQTKFIVTCDISEFYPRLNHHRLDNVLRQLSLKGDQPSKIMAFLKDFSNTYSFGLPVGGPAARILSELLLDQVDRLLRTQGIEFCRFADDFHLFADSYENAFKALLYLSERLLRTQGLQLQKAKTRIMTSEEFIATNPLGREITDAPAEVTQPSLEEQSQNLMRLSIRFDPYSSTADEDYEALRAEIGKIDLLFLLKAELTKSRVHISLSKRIISAIKYIDEPQRSEAVLSLIQNEDLLYPIYANVLLVAKTLYEDLREEAREEIIRYVRTLLLTDSHVLQTDLNLCYAVRLLSCKSGSENEEALHRVFNQSDNSLVRKDVIITMARWRATYWLSNLKANFRTLNPIERRSFLVASFAMRDEGSHWRSHTKAEFSPFERLVQNWAEERTKNATWNIPL
jgi:hypothetical protein